MNLSEICDIKIMGRPIPHFMEERWETEEESVWE